MITPYRRVGLAVCRMPGLSVVLPDGGDSCSHGGEGKSYREGSKHDTRGHAALPFFRDRRDLFSHRQGRFNG
jgi:hypothetical protein